MSEFKVVRGNIAKEVSATSGEGLLVCIFSRLYTAIDSSPTWRNMWESIAKSHRFSLVPLTTGHNSFKTHVNDRRQCTGPYSVARYRHRHMLLPPRHRYVMRARFDPLFGTAGTTTKASRCWPCMALVRLYTLYGVSNKLWSVLVAYWYVVPRPSCRYVQHHNHSARRYHQQLVSISWDCKSLMVMSATRVSMASV